MMILMHNLDATLLVLHRHVSKINQFPKGGYSGGTAVPGRTAQGRGGCNVDSNAQPGFHFVGAPSSMSAGIKSDLKGWIDGYRSAWQDRLGAGAMLILLHNLDATLLVLHRHVSRNQI